MNKLGQEIIEAITTEEYETIIFDYLANYCVNLKDENIKEIVNLKCKQFLNILKEKKELKEQVKYLRRSIERKEETIIDLRNDNTLCSKEYVSKLEKEKQELVDYLNKKCKKEDGRTDFDIFIKLNEQLKTLEDFAKHIDYNLHPIITEAYKCDVRNSINEVCNVLRHEVVYKDNIKEILSKIEKR